MQRPEWIALDLETTGLVAEIDRVVEIGAVRFDAAGTELGRFERLVNPERPMSPAAQAVHGLSDADLRSAPPARAVLPELQSFLGDPSSTRLIAHNATFDTLFLGFEFVRAGLPLPGHGVIDTLALAHRCFPGLVNYRLDTLARLLGLGTDAEHRALADCLRVKGLWLAARGPDQPAEALVVYPIADPRASASVPVGWDSLTAAIARGARVRIEYLGGSRGEAPREVTPRAYVHRGGIAYVVAYCHLDCFEKSFRLDRVRRIEIVMESD